jgi:mutator protein MutT
LGSDVRVQVALGLVADQGAWLVTKRSPGRVFAGMWEFPGGKFEPGETAEVAAVREVEEETGAAVRPVTKLGVVQTEHGGSKVELHLVVCEPVGRVEGRGDGSVAEMRWVSTEQLADLQMPPANREIVRRILGLKPPFGLGLA